LIRRTCALVTQVSRLPPHFAPSPPEPQPARMIATPAASASRAIPAEG